METLLDCCVGKMLTGNLIRFPADQTMPSTKQSEKVSDGDFLGRARPHLQSDEEVMPGAHEVPREIKGLWTVCQGTRRDRNAPGRSSPPFRQQRISPPNWCLNLRRVRKGVPRRRMPPEWKYFVKHDAQLAQV